MLDLFFSVSLAVCGSVLFFSMICTATRMPEHSPWTISLVVAGTVASSVGIVVTAISGDLDCSLRFFCLSSVLLLAQVYWRVSIGLKALDFLTVWKHQDANQH